MALHMPPEKLFQQLVGHIGFLNNSDPWLLYLLSDSVLNCFVLLFVIDAPYSDLPCQ